jgi:glucose/arabinose dehydrogenase
MALLRTSLFLLVLATIGAATSAEAQPVVALQTLATGLARPVSITHAGDGSGRLFITLQAGRIVIYDGTQILPTPFLDITDRVRAPASSGGEFGLLSVAFHPDYATNGFLYVHYTDLTTGDIVISRFGLTGDPNVADPGSEQNILTIPHDQDNHFGGQLQFGPDGFLYVSVGDGGEGGDPENDSQNLGVLLGKLLRLDVDAPSPFIPPGNPFGNEIWHYGLRNPWRFSFDRLTGDVFIGDVGQDAREEIDFQAAGVGGLNYGWRRMEGSLCFEPPTGCGDPSFVPPILELEIPAGNCSIIGGYRYRGSRFPSLFGTYLYTDFCAGLIYGATRNADGTWSSRPMLATPFFISTFGQDQAGELYLASYAENDGAIHRIVVTGDRRTPGDYDGDGKTDLAVFRGSTGEWFIFGSATGFPGPVLLGAPGLGDIPVPADYDGDGKADLAVFRTTTGQWFVFGSATGFPGPVLLGAPGLGDLPVPSDYDGDGKADLAVFRTTTGQWFVFGSATGFTAPILFGAPGLGDIPLTKPAALR